MKDISVSGPVSRDDLAAYQHLVLEHGLARATMLNPHQLPALHDEAHKKGGHKPGTLPRYSHGVMADSPKRFRVKLPRLRLIRGAS